MTRANGLLNSFLIPHGRALVTIRGVTFELDPCDVLGRAVATQGDWERTEVDLFLEAVRPRSVVVDIGANFGLYTLLGGRALGTEGHVIAVEPAPDRIRNLQRNLERNGVNNVSLFPCAISDQHLWTELYVVPTDSGLNSLRPENTFNRSVGRRVLTMTLDELTRGLPDVSVVRMDIQGAEVLALRGAQELMARDNVTFFIEFWPYGVRNFGADPHEFLSSLFEAGYHVSAIDNQTGWISRVHQRQISELVARCESVLSGTGHLDMMLYR